MNNPQPMSPDPYNPQYPPQGYPPQGYPQQQPPPGYPQQGYPQQPPPGYPQQPQQQYPPQQEYQQPPAAPVSGYPAQGGYAGPEAPVSGYPVSGYPASGYPGAAYPVSGYPGTQLGAPMPPPPGRKKRKILIASLAGAIALLLVGGIGAWAAMKFWFDSGDQPEQAMPATVSVYGRLDLSPSLDQSLKLYNLAKKFPQVKKKAGNNIGEMEAELFKEFNLKNMSFETDVKPWFAHKIGVGLWSSKAHESYGLIAIASSDDGKANTALKKVLDQQDAGTFGYSVRDGWALVALGDQDSPAAAKEAETEATRQSLAANATFDKALGAMPSGQMAIGWSDLDLLRNQLKSDSQGADRLFSGLGSSNPTDDMTGHILVAAQASSDGIELRARYGGAKTAPKAGTPVIASLAQMPANTALGLAISAAEGSRSIVDIGGISSLVTGTDEKSILDAILGAKLATIAVMPGKNSEPGIKAMVDARTSDAAKTIADAADEVSGSTDTVKVTRSGNKVTLSNDEAVAGTGTLGDQPLYRTTMAGMPANTSAALYLNVAGLYDIDKTSAEDRTDFGPLKAVGVGIGVDGSELSILIRGVIQ